MKKLSMIVLTIISLSSIAFAYHEITGAALLDDIVNFFTQFFQSANPCSSSAPKPPTDQTRTITHQGRQRTFNVHIPPSYNGNPTVVVFNFHGYTQSAAQQASLSKMTPKADREGFIVVYPQGISNSWNAGSSCCGTAQSQNIDDVGFVNAMIDNLVADICIDQNRIYSTGMSNGAMLSHRLACELSNKIAAIGPVAGRIDVQNCNPSRPVSVMHFHGTDDPLVPYGAAQDTIQNWATRNSCQGQPVTTYSKGDSKCETYQNCAQGTEVTLCTVGGGGHAWPGGAPVPIGKTTRDLNATDAMWDFFKRHPLNIQTTTTTTTTITTTSTSTTLSSTTTTTATLPRLPDLIVIPIEQGISPLIIHPGDSVVYFAPIKNQGNGLAGLSIARFNLDIGDDGTFDLLIAEDTTSPLAPGINETHLSLPWTAISGRHRFQLCADIYNDVIESNESNNCASLGFTVENTTTTTSSTTTTTLQTCTQKCQSQGFSSGACRTGSCNAGETEIPNSGTTCINLCCCLGGVTTTTTTSSATTSTTLTSSTTTTLGTQCQNLCSSSGYVNGTCRSSCLSGEIEWTTVNTFNIFINNGCAGSEKCCCRTSTTTTTTTTSTSTTTTTLPGVLVNITNQNLLLNQPNEIKAYIGDPLCRLDKNNVQIRYTIILSVKGDPKKMTCDGDSCVIACTYSIKPESNWRRPANISVIANLINNRTVSVNKILNIIDPTAITTTTTTTISTTTTTSTTLRPITLPEIIPELQKLQQNLASTKSDVDSLAERLRDIQDMRYTKYEGISNDLAGAISKIDEIIAQINRDPRSQANRQRVINELTLLRNDIKRILDGL